MAEQGGVRVRAGSVTASVQDQPASSLQKSYRGTDFLAGNLCHCDRPSFCTVEAVFGRRADFQLKCPRERYLQRKG